MKRTALLLLFLVASAGPTAAAWQFGPYLQVLGPDTAAVCLQAETGDTVEVSLLNSNQNLSVAQERRGPVCLRFTGLVPDRTYRYMAMVNGHMVLEEPASFLTEATAVQTFAIYGDTRSGDDSFDLAHAQVVKALRETTVPDAIIHTGDFVERADKDELWRNFFLIEGDILSGTPLYPAVGRSDSPPELARRWFPFFDQAPWYSFDRGDAHFVVTDLRDTARQDKSAVAATGAQAQWLRADLAAARERGARFLFVVIHEPPIDPAGRTPDALREVFMPILESYDVTAVFSGAHYFSHAVRGDVHYFTNGGGGALLDARPARAGVFRFFSPVHHFIVLETGGFGARIRAVDSHGQEFYAVSLAGFTPELPGRESAVFVEQYAGGTIAVPVTVYFRPGDQSRQNASEALQQAAVATGVTIVATYRSVDAPDNRARLTALANPDGPLPTYVVGDRVVRESAKVTTPLPLETALREAAAQQQPPGAGIGRVLALAAALLGLAVLAAAAWRWRRAAARKTAPDRQKDL